MKGSLAKKTGIDTKKKGVSFDSHTKTTEKADEEDPKPLKFPRLSGLSNVPGSVPIGPGIVYHNPDLICSSNDVGRVSFSELLTKAAQLRVPLFQRRYCWDKRTWAALLRDILAAKVMGHSLGRALVYHSQNSLSDTADGKANDVMTTLTIIDGQQRTTTLMVLLAALRDVMLARIATLGEELTKEQQNTEESDTFHLSFTSETSDSPLSSTSCASDALAPSPSPTPDEQTTTTSTLSTSSASSQQSSPNVTFHMPSSCDSLAASSSPVSSESFSSPPTSLPALSSSEMKKNKLSIAVMEIQRILFIKDDSNIEHCRLVPTHFDRPAYMRTMTISNGEPVASTEQDEEEATNGEGISDKTEEEALENRLCEAKDFFIGQLSKFSIGALLKLPHAILHRMTFLYFNMREQDLMTVYERMAIKEGMFKGLLYVATPGVQMTSADLTRNLLLSYFVDDAARIQAYDHHWIHIELRASEKGVTNQDFLEAILADYLLILRRQVEANDITTSTVTTSSDVSITTAVTPTSVTPTTIQTTVAAESKNTTSSTESSPTTTASTTSTVETTAAATAPTPTTTATTTTLSSSGLSANDHTTNTANATVATPSRSFMGPPPARMKKPSKTTTTTNTTTNTTSSSSTFLNFSTLTTFTTTPTYYTPPPNSVFAPSSLSALSSLGPSGDALLSETFRLSAKITTTTNTTTTTTTITTTASTTTILPALVPYSVAHIVGEQFANACVGKAFERPTDPLRMSGADRVGGIYGWMRRYLLALVPDSSPANALHAAQVAAAVMADLATFAQTWCPAPSLSLNQKGLLHGKLELVDLIRAMEENKGR